MPYSDAEQYKQYQAMYRQTHLFEAGEYRAKNVERQREYERDFRYRERASYDGRRGRQFAGFDGEGHGTGYEHEYYLLRMGNRELRTGSPLTYAECLPWIADAPPTHIYCVYYGTYDCTMILRGLPPDVLDLLMHRGRRAVIDSRGRTVFKWVRYDGLRLDYIPRKRLSVGWEKGPTIAVHDVGGFFQEAFIRRLENGVADGAVIKWNDNYDIASEEEIEKLCEGKSGRGIWNALSEETAEYNRIECEVLARLMSKLNDATHAVGLEARPFEGAGNLAGSMYQEYVAKPHRRRGEEPHPPLPPEEVPAMGAYYGGRFEITAHGPVPGPIFEYDIISAYPAVMRELPCLWHGEWIHGRADDARVRLGYIHWQSRKRDRNFGPVPVRLRQGNIMYPLSGSGWYWDAEWPGSDHYDVDILDCWSYIQTCKCRPYDWINNVFSARRAMGKSGKGYVLKLGMNSLYGKTAQTVGEAPWHNPVYAGLIVAMTRKRLYDLAMQSPDDIIMFATDAVYSLRPLDPPISTELGDWEMTEYDSLHIVQPGIYFDKDGAKVKTRGVARKTLVKYRQEIIKAFDRINSIQDLSDPKCAEEWGCRVEYDGLITLRLACSWGKPEKAGYFGKLSRRLSYYTEPKRPASTLAIRDGVWRTRAPKSAHAPSVPYRSVYMPEHDDEEMIDAVPDGYDSGQAVLW